MFDQNKLFQVIYYFHLKSLPKDEKENFFNFYSLFPFTCIHVIFPNNGICRKSNSHA